MNVLVAKRNRKGAKEIGERPRHGVSEERFDRRGVDAKAAEELAEFANLVRENDVRVELRCALGKRQRIGERQAARFADELRKEFRQPGNDFHAAHAIAAATAGTHSGSGSLGVRRASSRTMRVISLSILRKRT